MISLVLVLSLAAVLPVGAASLSAHLKSAPVWDVMKDAGSVTEALKAKGTYPLDDDHAFSVPQTAVRDSTSFTVYAKVRYNKLEVGRELKLLSQRTADTGWSWSVRYLPQGGSPMTFDANGITSRCGWFCRDRKPGVFEYVIAARRGFVTVYSNGKVLKNLVMKIVPNLEPIKVGENTSRPRLDAELLDLKFYGPEEEFWLPGEKPGFAASTIGGKGWQIDVPPKGPKEELPKVLLHGDSILSGYGPVLAERLRGTAEIYRWGGFDTQPGPVGPNWKEALASADYDIVVFNNGLHSLHWTKDKVSDEAVRASYASMVEAIRASAPKARAYCLLTTPYRGEADAVVVRLNDIARRVMSELNVPVIDAYTPLKGNDALRAGDPFHWKGAGYGLLADLVAKALFPSCGKPE